MEIKTIMIACLNVSFFKQKKKIDLLVSQRGRDRNRRVKQNMPLDCRKQEMRDFEEMRDF